MLSEKLKYGNITVFTVFMGFREKIRYFSVHVSKNFQKKKKFNGDPIFLPLNGVIFFTTVGLVFFCSILEMLSDNLSDLFPVE